MDRDTIVVDDDIVMDVKLVMHVYYAYLESPRSTTIPYQLLVCDHIRAGFVRLPAEVGTGSGALEEVLRLVGSACPGEV